MHKNKLIFLFNFVNHVCEFTQSVISTEVWRSIRRKYMYVPFITVHQLKISLNYMRHQTDNTLQQGNYSSRVQPSRHCTLDCVSSMYTVHPLLWRCCCSEICALSAEMMKSSSALRLIEPVVAHDGSYYATGECKQAVAGRVRQVVVDGRDCSMGKQSVLTKLVINARWSSMAGVAQDRFYCTTIASW